MALPNPIITLTTDFGYKDGYVAALKGTILSIVTNVRIVDISHDIAPHDIMEAAYVLGKTAHFFPPGTIHLVIVDPEAGSDRHAVGLKYNNQLYVGPDNGLFSLVVEGDDPDLIVQLANRAFWRDEATSSTSNGRDIIAPTAAHLANGVALSNMGPTITNLHPMHWALPITDQEGIQGWIVHIDRFGNCITNIHRNAINSTRGDRSFKCYVGNSILSGSVEGEAEVESGDAVISFNCDDVLEIAISRGSASSLLDILKGAPVNIVFSDERQIIVNEEEPYSA